SSRRRHTRSDRDWSSDVCSSDLALVCPEWPRWAANKGLRLDERGALLYPNETGPYEPKVRGKAEDDGDEEDLVVEEPPVPRIDRSEERRVGKEWRGRWSG